MKQLWERIAGRIDAYNLRERGLLFAVLVVLAIALAYSVVYRPMLEQEKRAERQVEEDRKATRTIQLEIEKMALAIPVDPNIESRAKLTRLTTDADAAEVAVRNLQKGLVSPAQISEMLENILARQGKLRLISLKKLPLQSIVASKPKESVGNTSSLDITAPPAPIQKSPANAAVTANISESIYKHGVEIVVQGQYFDIMEYLAALEKLPQQVFWGNANFKVDEYPKATLTLDIFTLSLEKKWMSM